MGRSRTYSVGSMVLGIISFFTFCLWYVSVPCAIGGIVLGVLSLRRRRSRREMAAVGLALSFISILLVIAYLVMYDILYPLITLQ